MLRFFPCPDGWSEFTAARGRFLRGIDSTGTVDPDGVRAAGSVQADDFKSHSHNVYYSATGGLGNVWAALGSGSTGNTGLTTPTGGDETRPKNVAVLYCQKD
jgi:hypothetical protein